MSNVTKLIHCRDEAELNVLKNVMPAIIENAKVVFGLTVPTQVELISAKKDGAEITTTGLPLDVASSVGKVTVVRAWDKMLPGGGRSTGCQPPKNIAAVEIMDADAWQQLQSHPLFMKAIGTGESASTEELP